MRKSVAFFALLAALSSCGGPEPRDDRSGGGVSNDVALDAAPPRSMPASPPPPPASPAGRMDTFNAEERAAGPNVSPTAAPGVAFNYSYAFRLEAQRIAMVQERHASLCESLGPNRCRITGMLYRVRNERDIEARLDFKLDPAIARRFGREGVGMVTQAEGMLVESQIAGTDAGAAIRQAGRSIADMEADLRRVEGRLAGRLSPGERESLEFEAQQLRQSIRAVRQTREDRQESLANTPMTFVYGSGELVPGFDNRHPIGDALDQAGRNFVEGIGVLILILVTLLPWALVAWIAWLVYRSLRRRRVSTETGPAAAAPEV
ncbi:MAG TPA: hypothetical protein VF702_00970 [Allosphingosinicella sp.]|jgi:hypothetical protein